MKNKVKPIQIPKHRILLFIFFTSILFVSCNTAKPDFTNREQNFDTGWKFNLGDAPYADSVVFDDSQWRTVDLPHDWSIEDLPEVEGKNQIGPFSEDSPGKGSTGHVIGGVGWYRKRSEERRVGKECVKAC